MVFLSNKLPLLSDHEQPPSETKNRSEGDPGLLLENRCPDSGNTFLTPAFPVCFYYSDAHICQTSPCQLPADPSACLDMMRGGARAPFKGFEQREVL